MATMDRQQERDVERTTGADNRMTGSDKVATVRWTSGTNIAAGVWLLAAPFLLGYGAVTAAVTNAIIIGLAVLGMAWYRTANPAKATGLSWTNAALGGWLVIAPFVLGYSATTAAVANDIIVGLIVLTLGAVSAVAGNKLSTVH